MTQKESIKQNIAKLEKTLKDPKVPAAFKDKLKSGIGKLEDELKALDKADTEIKKADTPAQTEQAKERKKKTVSKVAKILERAKLMNKKVIKLTEQQISKKVRRAQKLSTSDADIEKDAKIPAKPRSIRVSQGLTGNQYGTKDQNKGRKYYEYRDNRTDRQQPPTNYPKLEEGGMMAKGGVLKEGSNVWNAIGKKLVVDKVTKDEYYLVGFGQPSASPFSKSKVDGYIKSGQWTLKPKMAEGGKVKPKRSALEKLKGMSKKGKKPVVTRGFSDDEAYEYGSGGMMAKGGLIEHGLKEGDKIVDAFDNVVVVENDGKKFVINLNVGKRWTDTEWWSLRAKQMKDYQKMADGGYMAKGGRPRVIRGFSDDEEYEYGNGGHMLEKSIRQSTIVKPNLSVFN
jgi:hypothetical protein